MLFVFVLLFITSLTFVTPATVHTRRTSNVSAIMTDIDRLTKNVMELKNAITAMPVTGSEAASAATTVQTTLSKLAANTQDLGDTINPSDSKAILVKMTTLQQEVIRTISAFDSKDGTTVPRSPVILSPLLQSAGSLLNEVATGLQAADPSLGEAVLGLKNEIDNKAMSVLLASPFLSSIARGLGLSVE